MADSDQDYDDDVEMTTNGASNSRRSGGRAMASRPKERAAARWEAAATSNWELHETEDGGIEGILGGIEEAGKRKRYDSP